MIELKKTKSGIICEQTDEVFEETYNRVYIDLDHMSYLGISIGDYPKSHQDYQKLLSFISHKNIYLERIEVPNKRVETNVIGTSKLIKHPKTGEIEIAYRRKNKSGKLESFCNSPKTCYIDNEERERFFDSVKYDGHIVIGKYSDRYILRPGDTDYRNWDQFMKNEYFRLSGINPSKQRKQTVIKLDDHSLREREQYMNSIDNRLIELPEEKEILFWKECAKEGLCKISDDGVALYDMDGYLIQYLALPLMLTSLYKIISKLQLNEVKVMNGILVNLLGW